jgi:hypothetical protein
MGTASSGNQYINAPGAPRIAYRKLSEWCAAHDTKRFMLRDVKAIGIDVNDIQRLIHRKGIMKVGTETVRVRSKNVIQNVYRIVYTRPS